MLRLIVFILIFIIHLEIAFAEQSNNFSNCNWDNKLDIPCVEIRKDISNSSKLSNDSINRKIITKKQIQEIGASDLIDVLKLIPDISLTQSGPKGQQTSVFMRGTGSNHTIVMINGIQINDQSTTQGLHDFGVDFIQTIQQIEIYPGSGGSHFGTNAIGGAINIILTGDYKNSWSISSDQNSNYELFGNRTFVNNNSSLNLKVGTIKHETISARGSSSDEKDGVRNYSANLNYERYINNTSKLYNTIYLRRTSLEYDNSNTNQTGYEVDNKMGSYQLGIKKNEINSKNNYVFYFNIYDREYDERGTIDTYESNTVGLKYDISKIFNDKISLGLGSEYKYDWGYFDNNGSYSAYAKGNSDNFSIYSNIGWNAFKNFNISYFGRNDHHKQTGSNQTYKINLQKNFKKINIGTSLMSGLRNPTLYEMYGTDNFGYSGNKYLKPEKSNTYEIYSGIKLSNKINLSVRAFNSNIKNNIEYINNKYQNDNDNVDLNQSGLNTNLSMNFKNTELSLFSSFLSSKKENNSDQLRRPENQYGFNLTKKIKNTYLGDFDMSLLYNHYGKHFDTHSSSFSTIEMDSTDIVDLKLSKKFLNNSYYFKISNLLDENYQRPHGYNQEGRSIKIGFNY